MVSLHQKLLVLVLFLTTLTYCIADDPVASYCNPKTIIPTTGPVSNNIDNLLSDVVQKFQRGARFIEIEAAYDNGSSQVYGLAQCRGDVGPSDCLGCIQDAAQHARKLCPNQADARIWYDYCFLRYSQDKFFGDVDTSYGLLLANVKNVTDPDMFNKELGKMFDKIDSEAAKPLSEGLGKAQKKLSDFDTLYGLVQCTRDLDSVSCAQCLAIAIQTFEGFCSDKKGCRVLYSSCYVRYELYPFFFPLQGTKVGKSDTLKRTVIGH